MNVGNWTWSRTMHFIIYFKCLPQICTKMHGFKIDFSKIFWGGAHRAPVSLLPRPLPPFFSGLRPRFGLRPPFSGASRPRLGLRPPFSGASRPRFGLHPQLSIGDLGLAPPKVNSWIRQCWQDVSWTSEPFMTRYWLMFRHWRILSDVTYRLNRWYSVATVVRRGALNRFLATLSNGRIWLHDPALYIRYTVIIEIYRGLWSSNNIIHPRVPLYF